MIPALTDLVAAELAQPVDARVADMAATIAARYPRAARAVLFYGSCLRQAELDGLMLDFYLIVSSYDAAYGRSWLVAANRLIPPNVFPFEHEGLAAKYAVLSEADFARECGPSARSVSVWARFAQPSRLAWVEDEAASKRVVASIKEAAPTLFALTRPAMTGSDRNDPIAIFRTGFDFTYGAELRAERKVRAASIVEGDLMRYERIGRAVMNERPVTKSRKLPTSAYKSGYQEGAVRVETRMSAMRAWRRLQRRGKALSVLRLAKASFTFAGGVDYLAWKVSRHSGQAVEIRPWHRRFPLAAAVVLLPRLLARGAIR